MEEQIGILASNLKFLRKKGKLSQAELASKLNIKRSNIAAYESKGVEPRLRMILEIARFFDISVGDLIEKRLFLESEYKSFNNIDKEKLSINYNIDLEIDKELEEFIAKSIKIKKVLEGFKVLYSFRKKDLDSKDNVKQKLIYDIDNFIDLIDKFMLNNEKVITNITHYKTSQI